MINWFQIPLTPLQLMRSAGMAFLARAFTVRKNQLLSLPLRKRLHKSGSISFAWALLCLCNLDAAFMQSGSLWSLIPSNWKVVHPSMYDDHRCHSSPHRYSLAAHFQESCHFLFLFSFSYTGFAFLFFSALLFLLETDCCLSRTAAATCESNSLEYGRKFLIAKARLLTLTWT